MLGIAEIEDRVCDIAAYQLGLRRDQVGPSSRLIEDLHFDSLEIVELLMELEDAFGVALPDRPPNAIYKSVFTRSPFRLSDLAELVYLQRGTSPPDRHPWRQPVAEVPRTSSAPFSQLGGRWSHSGGRLFDLLVNGPIAEYRRRSDGMCCKLIPAARVEIGCQSPYAAADEYPVHTAQIDPFLIDAEPVSTTAFCRFLNSTQQRDPQVLADWFVLAPQDDRQEHMLVANHGTEWQPVPGVEHRPMMLVSWYGANAYSLWANGRDWRSYRDEGNAQQGSFLPSEAQWEYAARGVKTQDFPWGNEAPSALLMRYGQHRKSLTYVVNSLPLANVNELLGMSPFGVHHMAGNVWQWCRDWYDSRFYATPEASQRNPLNRVPSRARSERGGSWIGPADLCRSSYRRGRNPHARGRCLGFRCVSLVSDLG